MAANIIGAGWGFPVRITDEGSIARDGDDSRVRSAIWLILSTAPGERVMRPDFGCGIHSLVFAPANASTIGLVIRRVRDALTRWEPRVDVRDVDATTDPRQPGVLLIQITYRLRSADNLFNLVYPFYLDRGAR